MRTSVIFFLSVAVFLDGLASSHAAGPRGLTLSCGEINGTNYCQTIDSRSISELAKWSPETDECPLGTKGAIAAARAHLVAKFPDATEWNVTSILLKPLWDSGTWYYVIWFHGPSSPIKAPQGVQILVALNRFVPDLCPIDITVQKRTVSQGHYEMVIEPRCKDP